MDRFILELGGEVWVPKYIPIDTGVGFNAMKSDLLSINWGSNHLSARFALPDNDAHALQISFNGTTIVRLLDEFPLSTEHDPKDIEGLVPFHFAYRVEEATFARTQSEAWTESINPTHYQFITGWGCMDVLSGVEPTFAKVAIAS